MSLKVTFNDSKLKKTLAEHSKRLGKNMEETIMELATATAKEAARRMEPMGLGTKQATILEGAIIKDVRKVYQGTGQVYNAIKASNPKLAAAYAQAVNEGDLSGAENIARKTLPNFAQDAAPSGLEALTASRGARGRVEVVKRVVGVGNAPLDGTIKQATLHKGYAKAGWLQAATATGSKARVAKWLKAPATLGGYSKSGSGAKLRITLTNTVRYASQLLSEGVLTKILMQGLKNTVNRLKRL